MRTPARCLYQVGVAPRFRRQFFFGCLYSGTGVDSGDTPNRDSGNAISQRQAATGGFVALRAAGPDSGTAMKLYAYDMKPYVYGDVDGNDVVTCPDLSAAKAAVGKRSGQAGFVQIEQD